MIRSLTASLVIAGLGAALAACSDDPAANTRPALQAPSHPAPPFARLTARQYKATIVDLFAPQTPPKVTVATDPKVGGFDDNAGAQTPSAASIEAYHKAATALANAAMNQQSLFLHCNPMSRPEEDACARDFVVSWGKKAWRAPLEASDVDALMQTYTAQRTASVDFTTAMTMVVEIMLEAPRFLYRVELGTPDATQSVVRLTSYEVASRLSYLLWNSMPDDALFAAAEAGALSTPEGVEKEARRLLNDPRAHAAVAAFFAQWLEFDKMDGLVKDPTLYPAFSAKTSRAMRQSAERFVDATFFDGGTLNTLLTDPTAWVNDDLAPIYGVAPPGTSDLVKVATPAGQRSGILTAPGLMAGFAHETADAPVLRGVFVLNALACSPPPPPPPNVPPAPPASTTSPHTTRDRFAQQHEQGACAGCHHAIDGFGFGFEHYDAIGKYRNDEFGFPVDATGWYETGDLKGKYDGAIELGAKLAASKTVQSCVASQWMRYALGVDRNGLDPQALAPVTDAFIGSGLDLRELVVALVKSEAFRTRAVAQ